MPGRESVVGIRRVLSVREGATGIPGATDPTPEDLIPIYEDYRIQSGDVLFISIHEHPHFQYPGTGFEHEKGIGRGEGLTLNVPLQPGSDDGDYQRAFETLVLPALESFAPQCLLVSAGFDAHESDPLGHQQVSDDGFAWIARQMLSAADRLCNARLLVTLEGGYHLQAQARCVEQMLRLMLDPTG